jgi:hypothetical protein
MRTLRLALRTVLRTPALAAVAVLSLALGAGANAAIFSIFRQILVRPLPVRDPGGLVNLSAPGRKSGVTSSNAAGSAADVFSYPMFRDLERAAAPRAALVGIAAHRAFEANVAFAGRTQAGRGVFVSGGYFPLLGIAPVWVASSDRPTTARPAPTPWPCSATPTGPRASAPTRGSSAGRCW